MKATQATQNHLQISLRELIQSAEPKAVQAHRDQITYTKCQYTSFIWSMYYALSQPDRDAIRNNEGDPLLDDHIETALLKALEEYK